MLFNSIEFLIFFPLVTVIYYILGRKCFRNPFLLIASYFFYANWKPVYAILILISTLVTYCCGILLQNNDGNRKRQKTILVTSLILNLGILFIFKYYNFINESVFGFLYCIGIRWNIPGLDILLPVGISFYTFQAAGYSIDIYRGSIKAEKDFITYALFVSFFPQLVAGPIERARNLLPQFHKEHPFNPDNVIEGVKMMVWGYFMKLCIADILSEYVDAVYDNVSFHNGPSIVVATVFFTFQIYCDFAGYSNIAIGAAKVMGFDLMQNFRQPYFSMSIKEFWKRWHISLSTWFMDYLYIPLGGNRVKYGRHLLNLMITFLISGLWHGANWTFVLWGAIHGTYLVIGNLIRKYVYTIKYDTFLSKSVNTVICFALVCFAWIFFRANTIGDAFMIIRKILSDRGPVFQNEFVFVYGLMALFILIVKDSKDNFELNLNFMHSKHAAVRVFSIVFLISYIMLFGALNADSFIYFQF